MRLGIRRIDWFGNSYFRTVRPTNPRKVQNAFHPDFSIYDSRWNCSIH